MAAAPHSTSLYAMYPSSFSARDAAVTQRQASTALLAIDSEDRFKDYTEARDNAGSNRNPYSFTISKDQALLNGAFTRIAVTEVVFPWVIPNIGVTTDSIKVSWVDTAGGGSFGTTFVTLDGGFMTPSMIASALQVKVRAINASLSAFTMTYGINTVPATTIQSPIFEYKTNSSTVTISFRPIAPGDPGLSYPAPQRKQLFDLLGFSTLNSILDTAARGAPTFCQATRYVDIVCSQLTNNQALKDSMSQVIARDVLCRIYVGDAQGVQSTVLPSSPTFCPPGCMPTIIYKNYAQPKQIQWIPGQPIPGSLKFDVYDDCGELLVGSVGNGANWSLSLLVTES